MNTNEAMQKFLKLPAITLESLKGKGDIEGFPEFCAANRGPLERLVRARVDMRQNRANLIMSSDAGTGVSGGPAESR